MAIDTIKSTAVLDGAIATADIADDAVTADKLANAINTSIAAKSPLASPVFTGNVGIGVTPEAWDSSHKALQVGAALGLSSDTTINRSHISSAAYQDGTSHTSGWKYMDSSSGATDIHTYNGGIDFRVAPSGTADAAITWTTGFEVLADGKARAKNGLLFGTDTAAANALDDYEEGTWTPAFAFGGGTTGIAYLNTAGNYTKIGRRVSLTGYIQISSKGSSTGSAFLTGFPFTSGSGNGNASAMAMAMVNCSFADNPQIEMDPSTNSAGIRETAASNGAATAITDANFANNVFMRFSISYNTQ